MTEQKEARKMEVTLQKWEREAMALPESQITTSNFMLAIINDVRSAWAIDVSNAVVAELKQRSAWCQALELAIYEISGPDLFNKFKDVRKIAGEICDLSKYA